MTMRTLAPPVAPATAARKIRPARPAPLALELLEDRLAPASLADYGQVPISFVPNVGQADSQATFVAQGTGYALFLTPTQAVLDLSQPAAAGTRRKSGGDFRYEPRP